MFDYKMMITVPKNWHTHRHTDTHTLTMGHLDEELYHWAATRATEALQSFSIHMNGVYHSHLSTRFTTSIVIIYYYLLLIEHCVFNLFVTRSKEIHGAEWINKYAPNKEKELKKENEEEGNKPSEHLPFLRRAQ